MSEIQKPKVYDLEERTFTFAQDVRSFCKLLPKTSINYDDLKQLLRASGSVGANYIEANEALSKKDFLFRVRISRKEAKEAQFWLRLIEADDKLDVERQRLTEEAKELMMILGSILRKAE